jgi:hypothetical protein
MYIDRLRRGGDRSRGRTLSAQMYAAGVNMLTTLQLPLPSEEDRAVIRLRTEEEGRTLEEDAEFLRIDGVRPLDTELARQRLGGIFEDGIFYSLPDAPFPEAAVLTRLRDAAQRFGAEVLQLSSPSTLVRDANCESGVRIDCDGCEIFSKVAVAVAGAGNWRLLRDLEIVSAMRLRQTPLLVLHESFTNQAPIFVDRVREFSFVQHSADGLGLPNGALVIGTSVHGYVEFQLPDRRHIEPEDCRKFAEYLPPVIRDKISSGRFTAGYEVVPDERLRKQYFEPWMEWVDGFPGLLQAMPGRATMGMFVGQQVFEELASRIGEPETTHTSSKVIAVGWDDPIYMHYEGIYEFDDSK